MSAYSEQPTSDFCGNVTVDPLSEAKPAKSLEIEEILDCESGDYILVREWISELRYEQLIEERNDIRYKLKKFPRFKCSLCGVPVHIASTMHKHFFFRHQSEDGSCPANTRNTLSEKEIRARKYRGLQESEPHRRIKSLVARSLMADSQFSNTQTETRWRSKSDPSAWRQPDVQSVGPLGRMAFEIQVSTTFLDVVVERRAFYRAEGALLIWIMGKFDEKYRRLNTDDIFFTNNSNILIVDEETAALSESAGAFYVRCHFRRPVRDGERIVDIWESVHIRFQDLRFEFDRQRVWHFDYEREVSALREAIEDERHAQEAADSDKLRNALFAFWLARAPSAMRDAEALRAWADLRHAFAERNINLPQLPDEDSGFVALLNGIVSAKEGRPVGWNFKHLVEVGHRLANAYRQHIISFGYAINHFDRKKLIEIQDKTGKWKNRCNFLRDAMRIGDPEVKPDRETMPLVGFLVPGVQEKLDKYLTRHIF